MTLKIGPDVSRFKDILRNKIKHNLGKYVSSDDIVSQTGGGKPVKIPIHSIDLPRFTYSPGGAGGVGQGDGDVGDPMGGSQKKGQGTGKAGNEKGEHGVEAEFTPEELAKILGEALELPVIQDKGKGKVVSTSNRYNGIRRVGTEGLRHFKRTYKEALKRNIASGSYNPNDPFVVPIKADKRYRTSTPITNPDVNTAILYLMDISGSMEGEQRHIVKSEVFWIDLWLSIQYKGVETRFIVHDTEASEVSREEFFSMKESGGTRISSGLKLCDTIMKEDYPFSEWNIYPFYFSDGDNWSEDDNQECVSLLKDSIVPNCNVFSYGQTTSTHGSGEFLRTLTSNFSNDDGVQTSKIDSRDDILASIKTFLGKGK